MTTSDIPHRGSDFDAFLSIKPRISLAEEFEEVLVLVGQIEDHEPLSWNIEHMNPNGSSTANRGLRTTAL